MCVRERWLVRHAAIAIAAAAWLGCVPGASAQTVRDGTSRSLIDEVRGGVLAHSIDPNNAEDGVDLNLELLFHRPGGRYDNPWLDFALRPRIPIGASVNTTDRK